MSLKVQARHLLWLKSWVCRKRRPNFSDKTLSFRREAARCFVSLT